MIVTKRAEVGDTIKFKRFSYTNKLGGTSSADHRPVTDYDIYFDGIASGVVVYEFQDYETGQRFHARPDVRTWNLIKDKTGERKVYVSEFAVVEIIERS